MQDLIKKVGRFIESHVEKIVLVIVGLVCVVVFFKWVILSPTAVKLDRKTLSAGRIDREILERAKELERSINSTGDNQKAPPYKSVLTGPIDANNPVIAGLFDRGLPQGFMGLFRSPLSYVTEGAPLVPPGRMLASSFRRFKLPPRIGNVVDVAASHIRAAAYIPLEELTPEKGYDKVEIEVNDVDLVTVEAKFDTAQLYKQFRAHFAGEEVARAEWRDPCLAEPVFAAVQLQRRELLSNGAWAEWKEVPRSQVEPYRDLFKVIERVEDLPPGGLEIRMMQFKPEMVRMDLLQPPAYEIASNEEEWFPPSFYGKYKILAKKVEMEEKRDEREKDRTTTQTRDDGRYRGTTPGGGMGGQATGPGGRYRPGGAGGVGGDAMYGGGAGGRRRGATSQQDGMYGPGYAGDPSTRKRGAPKGRTRGTPDEAGLYGDMMYAPGMETGGKASLNEVYLDFGDELINYQMKLGELEKPLLFWAFDDTVQPGATYEYRIRLGVFNPVAGTNQIAEQDLSKKNQAILWSEFSDVTKPVQIQNRMYFFAKDVQEAKKSATVEVARYTLGYWRCEDFEVKPGEAIGKGMKPKVEEKKRPPGPAGARITDPMYANYNTPYGQGGAQRPGVTTPGASTDKAVLPDWVDYRTGKVLVDLVQVSDWGEAPNLRPRMYHEMLYTSDGRAIEHMPVSTTNWPKDLVAACQYVKTEMRREPQPFRAFKKGGMRSRVQPMTGGYEGMGGMYDEMMFMQPPPGGPPRR